MLGGVRSRVGVGSAKIEKIDEFILYANRLIKPIRRAGAGLSPTRYSLPPWGFRGKGQDADRLE